MSMKTYKGYIVSDSGLVIKDGKRVNCTICAGYEAFGEEKYYLHRVLAQLFLKVNVDELEIHHKDGNKLNNSLENLQALTPSEHIRLHMTGRKMSEETKRKISEANKGKHNSNKRKKVQMTVDGKSHIFNSITEASLKTGTKAVGISRCCRGLAKSAGKVSLPDGTKLKITWEYVE